MAEWLTQLMSLTCDQSHDTHLKCYGYTIPTQGREFHRSAVYICTCLLPPSKEKCWKSQYIAEKFDEGDNKNIQPTHSNPINHNYSTGLNRWCNG